MQQQYRRYPPGRPTNAAHRATGMAGARAVPSWPPTAVPASGVGEWVPGAVPHGFKTQMFNN
jgi:hypothetical protein